MKNLLKEQIDFTEPNSVKEAIQTLESSVYGGKNVDGEKVIVLLQRNIGMTVHVHQSNGWIRVDDYDAAGYKESETYNGRWNKKKFKNGDVVIPSHNSSRKLKIVDFDNEKQKYIAKLAKNNGDIDKRSIHRAIYVEEDILVKVQ